MLDTFSIAGIIIPFFFIIVIVIILWAVIKEFKQWTYNNQQPLQTVSAKVLTKRMEHRTSGNDHHISSSTLYYATFDLEDQSRLECRVSGKEYGQLAEGDLGYLTHKGTRFKVFELKKSTGDHPL
ncbi:DUF2500 domain-containing protein [Alkalihalobacillus trypoxylicola]|uniref:DUF2500 domain-containing protein n=1 Tax=Alkalihalobacillus trypoxylicola TaxID=519424 RepID=A0A161PGK3_9BACI|nr:DUF2500 domain-containing protein [Alkalihalobacillus trypoxylicola]KYG31914.1 hypothetical protein AZF04_03820 [Alkalihalobacillus trypoxylicola]